MSRYGFNVNNTEIVVGWDNPCQTFFGSLREGDVVFDTMIDIGRFDIKNVCILEKVIGFVIPPDIYNKLVTDRANATPQTPLQATISKMRNEML